MLGVHGYGIIMVGALRMPDPDVPLPPPAEPSCQHAGLLRFLDIFSQRHIQHPAYMDDGGQALQLGRQRLIDSDWDVATPGGV